MICRAFLFCLRQNLNRIKFSEFLKNYRVSKKSKSLIFDMLNFLNDRTCVKSHLGKDYIVICMVLSLARCCAEKPSHEALSQQVYYSPGKSGA